MVTTDQITAMHAELSPFLLRRAKRDVETSLPSKVHWTSGSVYDTCVEGEYIYIYMYLRARPRLF